MRKAESPPAITFNSSDAAFLGCTSHFAHRYGSKGERRDGTQGAERFSLPPRYKPKIPKVSAKGHR